MATIWRVQMQHHGRFLPDRWHHGPALRAVINRHLWAEGEAASGPAAEKQRWARLHHRLSKEESNRKPYSLTPLRPSAAGGGSYEFELRYFGELTGWPHESEVDGVVKGLIGRQLQVNRGDFEVLDVSAVDQCSFQQLWEGAGVSHRRQWRLELDTPTLFTTLRADGTGRGNSYPWPDPGRVLAALLRNWMAFADPTSGFEATEADRIDLNDNIGGHPVRLSSEKYLTHVIDRDHRVYESGAIGTVEIDGEQLSSRSRHLADALLSSARFTGLGDRTTIGMGAAQLG